MVAQGYLFGKKRDQNGSSEVLLWEKGKIRGIIFIFGSPSQDTVLVHSFFPMHHSVGKDHFGPLFFVCFNQLIQ